MIPLCYYKSLGPGAMAADAVFYELTCVGKKQLLCSFLKHMSLSSISVYPAWFNSKNSKGNLTQSDTLFLFPICSIIRAQLKNA